MDTSPQFLLVVQQYDFDPTAVCCMRTLDLLGQVLPQLEGDAELSTRCAIYAD